MIDVDVQYSHLSQGTRDYLRAKFEQTQRPYPSVAVVTSPPKEAPRESDIVRVLPSVSPDSVVLTSYRSNGRPFIRVELPAELAPAWIEGLERYTLKHDDTRAGLKLLD